MSNNNHHRIISSFTSLLSSAILKFSILAGCKTLDVCARRHQFVFHVFHIPVILILCTDILLEQVHTSILFLLLFVRLYIWILHICQAGLHKPVCVGINVFSSARLWHWRIHHASMFALRGWALTNQSPLPLLSNLGAIATLPMGVFNWSEDIKERLWQRSQKVKGWRALIPRLKCWLCTVLSWVHDSLANIQLTIIYH